MKHSRNHIMLLFLAVMVLIFVGAIYAYIYTAIGDSVARAVEARSLIIADSASQVEQNIFKQQYQTTANDWARLSGFFVPSDSVITFIKALESLGPTAGSTVNISAVDADNLDKASAGTQGTAHAHVEASGSWSAVMRTLSLAEDQPYGVQISNVRLASSGNASGNVGAREKNTAHIWNLSFDIKAAMIVPFATSSPVNQ